MGINKEVGRPTGLETSIHYTVTEMIDNLFLHLNTIEGTLGIYTGIKADETSVESKLGDTITRLVNLNDRLVNISSEVSRI